MVEALRHETFYVAGTWHDEELGVYVGWVARKESDAARMPLRNERGDVVLVFSGEEFPDSDTRRRLRARGHRFDMAGPGYLVPFYEEHPSFPDGLNGRFHGILADKRRGTTMLFNDRYGMHRVYFHESQEAFYFAAEAKAILAVRPELRQLDARGLGEFVSCGCVMENRTLFQGVNVLPGASAWVFGKGCLEKKRAYFHPREWEDQPRLEPDAYYPQLREIFSRNLPRYFETPDRIGMSLTGGLDSRMIMAWRKAAPESLPCYTFGGMFRDCRDVLVARQVARTCGQQHEVIPVGEEFLSRFAEYAQRTVYLTDGCADVSRSPDLYINARAREIAPVRMTGNYGGELLRRVRAFKPVAPLPELFNPALLPFVREAADTYAGLRRGHPLSFSLFNQGPWFHFGVLGLEETQLSLRSPFLDNDLVRLVFQAPESALAGNDMCLRLIADGDPVLRRISTDRGVGGDPGRLSAAVSRGVLEFLFKAEYAYDIGMPQSAARIDHLLSPLRLERLFLGRHKPTHFRVWYRDALAGHVRDILLDPRAQSRPYVRRKSLEAVVHGHLKGDQNYTTEIHKLLTLELLHRAFVDPRH